MKLYCSQLMDPTKGPRALQAKVMFDIRFYFARRGAENIKQMKVNTFRVVFDQQLDLIYIKKDKDELTKNHKEINSEIITGYMPEMRGSQFCPVDSFREYISHLNPNNDSLWQTPINKPKTSVWYADSPVGDHTHADFMKNLSEKAKLSRMYTNHDIRVTGISVLGRANFTDKQIMSGLRAQSGDSLKIYQKVSSNEKFMMGYTLAYALTVPQDIPIGPINKNYLPDTPKQRAILPKIMYPTDSPLQKRMKMTETSPVPAPITPINNPPQENAVAIPDEYDFDLLQLISETEFETDPVPSNAVVPVSTNITPTTLPPQQVQQTSTNNTQINIANAQRRLPGFFNCSIGTINFNVYQK